MTQANAFVLDASIAAKWVIEEAGSERALGLLRRQPRPVFAAPDLLLAEAASFLWKAVRRGEVTQAGAGEAMAALLALPIEFVPARDHAAGALSRAIALGHSAYDCLYLDLAMSRGWPLVTADRRLAALAPPGMALHLDELP